MLNNDDNDDVAEWGPTDPFLDWMQLLIGLLAACMYATLSSETL